MLILLMKRIIVFALTVFELVSGIAGGEFADSYSAYDFPLISAENQAPGTVRVMSFNILYSGINGNTVYDRITIGLSQIFEIMPDSFGLQEATNVWMVALNERLTMYDWVGVDMDSGGDVLKGGTSNPIFYLKYKYELVDSGYFWLSDTPDVPSKGFDAACIRLCNWVKLKDRVTGEEYVHVNTHYDHVSGEARARGALMVKSFIDENFPDTPVVFTADLNTNEKSEAYAVMTENLTDTRFAAKDCVTYGTFHGGKDPSLKSDYYIDFVLCSNHFDVASYRTVTKGFNGRFTSDHFPVYADLKLKN
ncbi:MAG: endonuclease/exonuclease/phosphatase family protein [Clostridia bacterium]|nr:endonuclease/exonuclease/phosphatase family protein [Clostridia bacterium]